MNKSVKPRVMPVKQIALPSGDHVGLKISSSSAMAISRRLSPLATSKTTSVGFPAATVAMASCWLTASQAPAE